MIYSIFNTTTTLFTFLLLISLSKAQSNSSNVTSIATITSTSVSLTNATQTLSQTLLPVPAYPTASGSSYSNSTAAGLAKDLPGYTYNLTSESLPIRVGICNQTTLFCSTSGCSIPTSNISTNFCNPDTMGWNCECNNGANSRLTQQLLVVPINSYDCKLRASACSMACQKPASDGGVLVASISACQNACNYILASTCGTSAQVIPQYQVKNFNDVPKYYPDTSKGGVALGITTSGSSQLISFSLIGICVIGGLFLFLV